MAYSLVAGARTKTAHFTAFQSRPEFAASVAHSCARVYHARRTPWGRLRGSGDAMSGPIATSRCSVCNDARLPAINAMIASGKTLKDVHAVHVGTSYAALRRHAANHVAPSSSSRPPMVAPDPNATPYEVMRKTVDDLRAIDTAGLAPRNAIIHLDALRRATESLARLSPVDPATSVIRVADVAGLNEFLGELLILRDRPRIATSDPDAARWMAVGWTNAIEAVTDALRRAIDNTTDTVEEAS